MAAQHRRGPARAVRAIAFEAELRARALKRLLRPIVARQFRTHHAHLQELL